jgi:hypothetical protein
MSVGFGKANDQAERIRPVTLKEEENAVLRGLQGE